MSQKQLKTGALVVVLCAFASITSAASLNVQWDANTETDLAGYVVRYGTVPGTYTGSVDVGKQITANVSNLVAGARYFFVVEAYNVAGLHGPRSTEAAGVATDHSIVMTLTLKTVGNAGGVVSAGGVSCDEHCTVSTYAGATLTLSPVSNLNAIFSGWEGSNCSAGIVTMTASTTCAGRFSSSVSGVRFDANRDGRGDVLTYRASDGLTQVLVTGTIGHGAATAYQSNWPAHWILRAGDFNGDGTPDMLAFDPLTGAWQTALGDGSGKLGINSSAVFAPAANAYAVDLNRDGRSDVFLHDPPSGAWQKCMSGTAGFSCEKGTWPAGWEVYPLRTATAAAGDLLLYNRATGAIQKVRNQTTGFTFDATTVAAASDVFTGDFDGDGNADIFLHSDVTGRWALCLNNVTGGVRCQAGQWSKGWAPSLLDLDGDGKAEVFLYNPWTGAKATARYNGGSLALGATTVGAAWWLYQPADFNGDGKDDMLITDQSTGAVWQGINTGAGQFQLYAISVPPGSSAATKP